MSETVAWWIVGAVKDDEDWRTLDPDLELFEMEGETETNVKHSAAEPIKDSVLCTEIIIVNALFRLAVVNMIWSFCRSINLSFYRSVSPSIHCYIYLSVRPSSHHIFNILYIVLSILIIIMFSPSCSGGYKLIYAYWPGHMLKHAVWKPAMLVLESHYFHLLLLFCCCHRRRGHAHHITCRLWNIV